MKKKAELEYHGLYVDHDEEDDMVQIEFVGDFTTASIIVAYSDLDDIINILTGIRDGTSDDYDYAPSRAREDLIPKLPKSQAKFDP